jgi:hypothetical protein
LTQEYSEQGFGAWAILRVPPAASVDRRRVAGHAHAKRSLREVPMPPSTAGLIEALGHYQYLPDLTNDLDNIPSDQPFTITDIFKIVLWKLNRFVDLGDALARLNDIGHLENGQHREAQQLLCSLLSCRGIRLPMASTILRFRKPDVFQVVDERAYRMAMERDLKLSAVPATDCKTYFEYLDVLNALVEEEHNLRFQDLDRALYQIDIDMGNQLNR